MNKLTGKEIIKLIEKSRRELYGYDEHGFEKNESWLNLEDIGLDSTYFGLLGGINLVETATPDGEWGDKICVWHFIDHDVYIKGAVCEGSQGTGYKLNGSPLKEVLPKQIEVTVFEDKVLLSAKEILDTLETSGLPVSVFAFDEPEYGEGEPIFVPESEEEREFDLNEVTELYNKVKESLGGWEEVDQYGGEGKGDIWYSVKYFPAHDVYIKTDGFYSSYSGVTFDDGFGKEVFPTAKTITVYQ